MSPDTNLPEGGRRAGLQGTLRTPGGALPSPVMKNKPQGQVWTWWELKELPFGSRNFLPELTAASRDPAFFSVNLIFEVFTAGNKQESKHICR